MSSNDFALANTMLKLNKKPKIRKVKKRGNLDISLKKLFRTKTIKKFKKEQLNEAVFEALPQIEKEVAKYYSHNSKILKDQDSVTDLLCNKKFAQAICSAIKAEDKFSEVIFYAVSDLYVNGIGSFTENESIVLKYSKCFKKFNDKKIVKLSKVLGIKKDRALQIAFACITYKNAKFKSIRKRYWTFLNEISDIDDLTEKKFIKAAKLLFGNHFKNFILAAMNQKPSNKGDNGNFNVITEALLNAIEKMDKDDRKKFLKSYAEQRKRNPKITRRVNLTTLSKEEYKGIYKTLEKLENNGMNIKLFV